MKDFKEFIKEYKEKKSSKCQELKEMIVACLDESLSRTETFDVVKTYFRMEKNKKGWNQFIECFNKSMDEIYNSSENSDW